MNGKSLRIAVTGVGAIIGQGIVKSLRTALPDATIIGIDRNPDALGKFFCDVFIPKPRIEENSKPYDAFWSRLFEEQRIDVTMPGLELDALYFNGKRDIFQNVATRIVLNSSALMELASDKLRFSRDLAARGFEAIPTVADQDWDHCVSTLGPPPLLLKPRFGNGSRGIVRLYDRADYVYWSAKIGVPFIVQRIIGNDHDEFTAGSFGLGNGKALSPIVFRRRLSVAGNTEFAQVVEEPEIVDLIERLTKEYSPTGPTNYQFRTEGGRPFLLEINPRFSSSTSLRTRFGYNEASMCIDYYLHGRTPEKPNVREGRGWRYYEDFIQ